MYEGYEYIDGDPWATLEINFGSTFGLFFPPFDLGAPLGRESDL